MKKENVLASTQVWYFDQCVQHQIEISCSFHICHLMMKSYDSGAGYMFLKNNEIIIMLGVLNQNQNQKPIPKFPII